MAGTTGLEPATSAVTGQRSNQLSYVPKSVFNTLAVCHIESSASEISLHPTDSLPRTKAWKGLDIRQTNQTGHQNCPCKRRISVYQIYLGFCATPRSHEEQ